MRNRGVLCMGFLLCALLTAGIAEGTGGTAVASLGLEEAIRLALAGNGDLQKQKIAYELAELKASSAWNVFLPSLNLSGTYSDTQTFSRDVIPREPTADLGVSAGISMSLNAGLGETMRQTVIASEAARLSWQQAEASLTRTVRKSYYTLVTDLASLDVSGKNLLLAKAQESLVARNYRSGLASELEYLQAQYTAASLEPDLIQKKNRYAGAVRSFNLLLGLPLESRPELTDAVSPSPENAVLPALSDGLLENRFDVRLAALNLEKAKSVALAGKLVRYAPSIAVSESARVSGLLEEIKMPETGTFSLTVSIPLNGYLPGSKEKLAGAETAGGVELAEIALAQTRLAARQETGSLYDTLAQLSETNRLNRLGEKLAARAYELSGQGYGSGLVTQADLDSARQKLLAAQLNVLTAESGYRLGLIDLAYALNMTEKELLAPGDKK